jgi:hypothetical protein
MDWTAKELGVALLKRGGYFPFLHVVQTGSGAEPDSYAICIMGSFLGVKRQECEANNLPPSSAEIKNGGAVTQLLHTSSSHCTIKEQGS